MGCGSLARLLGEASARAVVALDPGAKLGGLSPTLLQLSEDFLRQGSELASGEDGPKLTVQILRWRVPQHGDMPDLVKMEAVGGELAVRCGKEQVLSPSIGSARGLLPAEAGDLEID